MNSQESEPNHDDLLLDLENIVITRTKKRKGDQISADTNSQNQPKEQNLTDSKPKTKRQKFMWKIVSLFILKPSTHI